MDRYASDFELIDNIADQRAVFGVFKHGLGVCEGLLVHRPRSSAASPAFVRGLGTSACILEDESLLKFIERVGHVEKEPPLGRAGVDVLGQHFGHDATHFDVSRRLMTWVSESAR